MNIGFVYHIYQKNIVGINRYAKGILEKLADSVDAYCMGKNFLNVEPVKELPCHYSFWNNSEMAIKEQIMLSKLHKVDALVSFYPSIFPDKEHSTKSLLTIYDLSPLINPKWYGNSGEKNRQFFDGPLRESAKQVDRIMTISEATKRDIVQFYGVSEEKIKIAYPAIAEDMYHYNFDDLRNEINELKKKFKINGEYILSISTVQPRKNMESLIKAFEIYRDRHAESDLKLVLTGSIGWACEPLFQLLEQCKNKQDIILTGYVSDYEMAALYSGALAFVYVSFFEGFGMPILEAMHFGKAVLSSDTTSMPEVGGDAVCYCNPYEVESIAVSLEKLVEDRVYREELEKKAKVRAQMFSYTKSADIFKQTIQEML